MIENCNISIIITNYNKAKFLEKNLSSVTKQNIKKYEIIFYDDSSTDDSINIVNKSKEWVNPVITEVIAFSNFYPAEEAHQKYILKNPDGYSCHFVRKFDFTK